MKHPHFVFVSCCFSIFTATSCSTGYSCVTAYWDTVTCVLNITGDPANSTYSLRFRDLDEARNFDCPLVWRNRSFHTDCRVVDSRTVNFLSVYAIELCSAPDSCQLLEKWFSPIQHIRLTVPYDVKVQQTPEVFNFTWKSGYEDHPYFSKQFHYEILLEAAKSKESEPFNRTFQETNKKEFLSVSRSSLKSHNRYCIKVRSYSSYIGGIWSEWSKWTCWENDEEPGSQKTPVIVTKVLAPVCVLFAVLLFLFYSPAARMKIKTLSHTPSPAPFFQPLFQQYEGNLQDWLSSKSTCTIIYKNEETLMTDAVTVEPKPMKKEPEENLGLHEAPVMLPGAQTQTSYVGLPGRHQASSPVTVLCPGDSSYTQLPCSIWGFSLGGVQVEPPPTKASSEISCSDSGCSFDSLSESPDCSLPTSPAVDASSPFHCSDYCILNKTAEGVVPVLVTMGRSPRDAADPPRDEDHT